MAVDKQYDRFAAVVYAKKWALARNPAYYNFDGIGGDCTNFASQCIFAGSGIMNYTPVMGWYYRSASDRTASWTGVEYLYNFLINNRGSGPYAVEVQQDALKPGDIVQLGTSNGRFFHTPVVISIHNGIHIAAHSYDALNKPLDSYLYSAIRCLHIVGVRD